MLSVATLFILIFSRVTGDLYLNHWYDTRPLRFIKPHVRWRIGYQLLRTNTAGSGPRIFALP
jgi:hypothetical protein